MVVTADAPSLPGATPSFVAGSHFIRGERIMTNYSSELVDDRERLVVIVGKAVLEVGDRFAGEARVLVEEEPAPVSELGGVNDVLERGPVEPSPGDDADDRGRTCRAIAS